MSPDFVENPAIFECIAAEADEGGERLEESTPSRAGTTTMEIHFEFFRELIAAIMETDEAENTLIDTRRGEPTEPLEQVLAELRIG